MVLTDQYVEFVVFWDTQKKWTYTEFALYFHVSFFLAFSSIVNATSIESL